MLKPLFERLPIANRGEIAVRASATTIRLSLRTKR